jgi:nitrate reductase gamma subunit
MKTFIEFAKGPLFAITFTFMLLGLIRLIVMHIVQLRRSIMRLSYRKFNVLANIKRIFEWLIPIKHIYSHKPLLSFTSVIFHSCLLIVPIFLVGHIDLWFRKLGIGWPGIPPVVADTLTLIAIAAAVILFAFRVFNRGARMLSGPMDYFLLVALSIPFISGFMLSHPGVNPASYNSMLLLHVFSSELVFILIPTTKLAHCVLFPFDRFSSEIYWKMPIGAGDKVARELHGQEVHV